MILEIVYWCVGKTPAFFPRFWGKFPIFRRGVFLNQQKNEKAPKHDFLGVLGIGAEKKPFASGQLCQLKPNSVGGGFFLKKSSKKTPQKRFFSY